MTEGMPLMLFDLCGGAAWAAIDIDMAGDAAETPCEADEDM